MVWVPLVAWCLSVAVWRGGRIWWQVTRLDEAVMEGAHECVSAFMRRLKRICFLCFCAFLVLHMISTWCNIMTITPLPGPSILTLSILVRPPPPKKKLTKHNVETLTGYKSPHVWDSIYSNIKQSHCSSHGHLNTSAVLHSCYARDSCHVICSSTSNLTWHKMIILQFLA